MAAQSSGYRNSLEFAAGETDSGLPTKRRRVDSINDGILPCLVCNQPFRRRNDLWQHLSTKENGINVFVCLKCNRGFRQERLLRDHSCDSADFGPSNNDQQRMGISVFCHVIACEECGFFVALVNVENPSWRNYSSLCAHPSRSFRKITLYTWTPDGIRFIKNDLSIPLTVRIDIGPSIADCVRIGCEICGHKYSNVNDAEHHMTERHADQFSPKQCQQCCSTFSSSVGLQLHVRDKHGGSNRDLIEFLTSALVEGPFVEKTTLERTDSYVHCDLCREDFLGNEFNSHDCAVHYTRRFLLDGKVIFCHSAVLHDFTINVGIEDPFLSSLDDWIHRHVELCLRFFIRIRAPKVDDFKDDKIYCCKHCELVFLNQSLFREHVTEVLEEQATTYEWPETAEENQWLAHFGLVAEVCENGLICPKSNCRTTWCSPTALERHVKNDHLETFEPLTIPKIFIPENLASDAGNHNVLVEPNVPEEITEGGLPVNEFFHCPTDNSTSENRSDAHFAPEVAAFGEHGSMPARDSANTADPSTADLATSLMLSDDVCEIVSSTTGNADKGRSNDVGIVDDDEVAVCKPEAGSSKTRLPAHGCNFCSKKFVTQRAAEEHRQSHVYDAGETTTLVLPVPMDKNVFVCRFCCLAYEWYPAYKKHMENHKRVSDCEYCSFVCLNPSHLAAHKESHESNSLAYGCAACLIATRSETSLMLHLNERHGMVLLWFCKSCGLGNSDWQKMTTHSCREDSANPQRKQRQTILPAARKKLHFQPRDIKDVSYASPTSEQDVAECIHRTFLAPKENGVACMQCGSVLTATSFLLTSLEKEKYDGKLQLVLLDEAAERSLFMSHPFFNRTTTPEAEELKMLMPHPFSPNFSNT